MSSLLAFVALGFVLGMRHATDPDHVVAVTNIVSRHRSVKGAALIGALWGLGHTITVLVVGGGIVLFGWVIPPRLGLSLELSVGLMLIVLGVMNLATLVTGLPGRAKADELGHTAAEHMPPLGRFQLVRPVVVGIVHGLAGSAAVALLVLATIPDPSWAVLYLGVFGAGTIAGMMVVTASLGVPFAAGGRLPSVHRRIRVAAGALSLGFGLTIAWQVGVTQGLFTGHPQWTPR